MTQNTYRY